VVLATWPGWRRGAHVEVMNYGYEVNPSVRGVWRYRRSPPQGCHLLRQEVRLAGPATPPAATAAERQANGRGVEHGQKR
jgi:hypothetical protein